VYLLGKATTIEWEILATVSPPTLGELDLLIIDPNGDTSYITDAINTENYTPPTDVANGNLTYVITPELKGFWRVHLVTGSENEYQILSKVEIYVFGRTTSTSFFYSDAAVPTITIPVHFLALSTSTQTTIYEVDNLTTAIATLPVGGQRPVFSPDGEWLLIASTLYETRTWTVIDTVPNLHSGNVSFSVDRAMAALVPAGENTPVLVSTADWLPVAGAPTLSGYSFLISGALYAAARCVFTPDGKYLVNCASSTSKGLLDLATLSFVSMVDFVPDSRFTNKTGNTAAVGEVVAYTVGSSGPHPYRLADPISASTATWFDSGAQAYSVAISPDGTLIGYDTRGSGYTIDGVGYNGGFQVRPTDDATVNGQVFSGEAAGLPFGGFPRRARQAGFSTDGALFAAGEGESTATGANGALLFYTVGTWAPVTPPISTGVVGFDFAARA
jgi:WD40 repeat protein